MEANTLYPFQPTNDEEIGFQPGVLIKVINDEDKDWYKCELNGLIGYVPATYLTYAKPVWFMVVNKEEAAKRLQMKNGGAFQHPDGAFIVRPSDSNPSDLSLSVRINNEVQHFRILRSPQRHQYFLWNDAPHFNTVNQLVLHYRNHPVNRNGSSVLRDVNFPKVHVNYDFQSRSAEEMEIRRGEVITVVNKDDHDWWEGLVERDNVTYKGLFPANYVTQF